MNFIKHKVSDKQKRHGEFSGCKNDAEFEIWCTRASESRCSTIHILQPG